MMGPDSEIPVFPALDLHLHRTEARAGPPVSWELKPRDIVNTEKLLKAFVYDCKLFFDFLNSYGKSAPYILC